MAHETAQTRAARRATVLEHFDERFLTGANAFALLIGRQNSRLRTWLGLSRRSAPRGLLAGLLGFREPALNPGGAVRGPAGTHERPAMPGRFQVLPCMRAAYVLDPRIVSLTRELASGAARAPPGWGPEDLLQECKNICALWIKGQHGEGEDVQAEAARARSELGDYLLCQGRLRHGQID